MSFKKKDQEAIASIVQEMYSEGFLDRFKKKPAEAVPAKPTTRESTYRVMVYGTPRDYSRSKLLYDSETISMPRDGLKLNIYKTTYPDPTRNYDDFPIFIPLIVMTHDDMDFIPTIGKAHPTKEEAIEELNKLAEKYKPKLKQASLGI